MEAGEKLLDILDIDCETGDYERKILEDITGCLLSPASDYFQCLLEYAGQLFNTDRAFVFGIYNQATRFDELAEWTAEGISANINRLRNLELEEYSWFVNRLNRGKCIVIDDIENLGVNQYTEKEILEKYDVRAGIIVPILKDAKLVGAVGLSVVNSSRQWRKRTIRTMELIGKVLTSYWKPQMHRNKYYSIFNNSGVPVAVLDDELIVKEVNRSFEDLSGFSKEELVAKKSFINFIHPDYRDMISGYHNLRLKGEDVPRQYRFDFVDKKNNVKNIKISVSLQPGTGDTIVTLQDVTELNETYSELENNKYKLIEKNRELKAYNRKLLNLNQELEQVYSKSDKLSSDLENLIQLLAGITSSSESYTGFLSQLLETVVNVVQEADYGNVFRLQEDTVEFINSASCDGDFLNAENLTLLNNRIEEDILVVDSPEDFSSEFMDEELADKFCQSFCSLKEFILVMINDKEKFVGGLILGIDAESEKSFSRESVRVIEAFKNLAGAFLSLKRYNKLQDEFYQSIILSITKMLEIHDQYTRGHSRHVADLAVRIGEKMGLSDETLEKVYLAGMLHDIGKILIPRSIIAKKGKLSEKEFDLIKKHPVWGYNTLRESEELEDIAEYILYHHERWDGSGYPEGLKEDEIPLISQILGLADAWNAMRSNRSYRDALPFEISVREVQKNRGSQFSPRVVEAFFAYLDEEVDEQERVMAATKSR